MLSAHYLLENYALTPIVTAACVVWGGRETLRWLYSSHDTSCPSNYVIMKHVPTRLAL